MRIRQLVPTALAVACLLLCLGCNQLMPDLLLPGLTLPAGSTVLYRGARDLNGRGMRGVGFNCPGGWDVVKAHFDQVLGQLGYHAQSNLQDSNAAAVAAFPSASYMKDGGAYIISLEDMVKMNAMEHLPPPDPSKGEFQLTILPTAHGAAGK